MIRFIPPKVQRGRTVHSAGLTGLGLVGLTDGSIRIEDK